MSNILLSSVDCAVAEIQDNSRRNFLKKVAVVSSAIAFPNILLARNIDRFTRSLPLYHLTTGEFVNAKFWENGEYNIEELARVYRIMRDFHVNKETIIDINLIELASSVHRTSRSIFPFYLTSGFRTRETNERIPNAAKNSFHIKGQAIDIILPKFRLEDLRDIALSKEAGGVGYYPSLNFLHMDVGDVRTWTM